MRHLVYSVRYSVVPLSSSLLNITFYSSVIKTLIYNDKIFSPLHDITRLNCILFLNRMVNSEGIYGIVKIRIWKGKIAVFFFSEGMI